MMHDNSQDATTPQKTGAPRLDAAIDALRAEVSVRDDWRQSLLREVAALPHPGVAVAGAEHARRTRTFTVRPIMAIAACALAMLTGSVGTMVFMSNRVHDGTADGADITAATAASQSATVLPVSNAQQTVIRFALVAPGAKTVSIVGDFNGWNPRATPLAIGKDGTTWLVEMPLSNGRHVYAFVVDGDIVADPSAARVVDDDFGTQNSVVLVGDS